jgi:DNA-binding response OmpR family regulator
MELLMGNAQMKVLIADDDPSLRFVCRAALESSGHEVLLAEDGSQVLELVVIHRPDLLLMDVSMPYVGGLEVLKTMTAEQRDQLPVVLLSARSRVVERVEGIEAGAIAYITKPFQPDSLQRVVNEVLSMTPSDRRKYRTRMLQGLRDERLRQGLSGMDVRPVAIDLREGADSESQSFMRDHQSRRAARRQTAVAALSLSAVTGAGFSQLVDEMVFTAADVLPVRRVAMLEFGTEGRLVCRSVAGDGDIGSLTGKSVSQHSVDAFVEAAVPVLTVLTGGIFVDGASSTSEVWIGIPGCEGHVGAIAIECVDGDNPQADDYRFLQVCAGILSALSSSAPRTREAKHSHFSGFMRKKR